MRPLQGSLWGCALAFLFAASPAQAGWNNVFQVCCNNCGKSAPAPVISGYAGVTYSGYSGAGCDPCPTPCAPPPTTTCTTRYIQRTYYQPVTSYRTSYYMEPVTSYRTSYYYEPVCSYRYSCYYDPCTCSYQNVAQPVTSYQLRSRCCPVTSYLQRTCMTPVTTYQQMSYYTPETSCCTTSAGTAGGAAVVVPAPATSDPPAVAPATRDPATAPSVPAPPSDPPPGTRLPAGGTEEMSGSRKVPIDRSSPPMPPARDSRPRPDTVPPPAVRFDRIASRSSANVQGKVVNASRQPLANVRILLVSADESGEKTTLTANSDGSFSTKLPSGGWLVYTYDASGKAVFSRRVEVPTTRPVSMTLTQR